MRISTFHTLAALVITALGITSTRDAAATNHSFGAPSVVSPYVGKAAAYPDASTRVNFALQSEFVGIGTIPFYHRPSVLSGSASTPLSVTMGCSPATGPNEHGYYCDSYASGGSGMGYQFGWASFGAAPIMYDQGSNWSRVYVECFSGASETPLWAEVTDSEFNYANDFQWLNCSNLD